MMALTGKTKNEVLPRDTVLRTDFATYTVQDLIGSGRFSHVYKASVSGTGQQVVIKALNHSCSSMGRKELNLLNRLKSSDFRARYVRLVDAVQLGSGPVCFVMEKLGITLQAMLHNVGPLPMSACRSIVRQIAQGLVGLKCLGIVHADLKPDNIMFCSGHGNDLLVKIIDFGWAFHMENVYAMYQQKIQAIPYRAPEVCFRGRLDHGLDMWALGCIMPEIVTGVKLFDVANEELLINMIVRMLPVSDCALTSQITDDDQETKPSVGWIQFQNLYLNTVKKCDFQRIEDLAWFDDLLYKMLIVMPEERITAADALAHPFLTIVHFIKYPSTNLTKKNAKIMGKSILDI